MHIDFLSIIFRLTLFGLFAYKMRQLIKAYVIPLLKDELAVEKRQRDELLEKEKLLHSTQHRFENQIHAQKKTFTLLEKNAQLWRAHLLRLHDQNEKELHHIMEITKEKRAIQQHNLALAKDCSAVLPTLYGQAEQQLSTTFAGAEGKKLLHNLIVSIASPHKTT